MKRILLPALIGLLACTLPASAISIIHDYELNGSFADSLGGPSMVGAGGTLGASGYSFAPGQGPSLSGAIDPGNYTIEMLFHIDQISSWRRLLDFNNLTTDSGLYNFNSSLQFYPPVTGPLGAFAPGIDVNLVVTRDGSSGQFVGYINGVQQLTFTDSSSLAIFSGPGNIIHFLRDNTSGLATGENASGFLDRVRIYDGPASAAEVANGLPGVPVPDAGSTMSLLSCALLGLAGMRRRLTKA